MSSSSTYTIQEPPNIKIQRTEHVIYDERIEHPPAADLERWTKPLRGRFNSQSL
jgi:hypothetical protein